VLSAFGFVLVSSIEMEDGVLVMIYDYRGDDPEGIYERLEKELPGYIQEHYPDYVQVQPEN